MNHVDSLLDQKSGACARPIMVKEKAKIDPEDAMLAGIAIQNNEPLLTRNCSFPLLFRILSCLDGFGLFQWKLPLECLDGCFERFDV